MLRKKAPSSPAVAGSKASPSPQHQQTPSSPARQQKNNSQSPSNGNNHSNNTNKKQPYHLTEEQIDAQLRKIGLIRKAIPKDGACLFRATAEQLLANQNYHMEVRRSCVSFLRKHQPDFEPFVCCDGIPYDHYLYEMGKPDCWAGQVELQALSLHYKVNFVIYSEQPKPTIIDNGFSKNVNLCFLGGNHYDCVYNEKRMALTTAAQEIVYSIINVAVGEAKSAPAADYVYKNVGLLCYLNNLRVQRERDMKLAEGMQEVSHTDLSGFYKKEDGNTPGWEKKISRRSKKELSKKEIKKGIPLDIDILIPDERSSEKNKLLKQDLERIAELERKEALEKVLTPDLFPVLQGHAKPTPPPPKEEQLKEEQPKEEKPSEEKKESAWGSATNWKTLFAPPPPPPTNPTPIPKATQAKKPKKSRSKKSKSKTQPPTTTPPSNTTPVVTIVNNDAQLGNVNITFGSIAPSSPSPARTQSTTPHTESALPKETENQPVASSPISTTPTKANPTTPIVASTTTSATAPSAIPTASPTTTTKANSTVQDQESDDIDPELRSISIVFGSLPASSFGDNIPSSSVTLRLSKHKTRRSDETKEEIKATATTNGEQHLNGFREEQKDESTKQPNARSNVTEDVSPDTRTGGKPSHLSKPYTPSHHTASYDPQQHQQQQYYIPQYHQYYPPGAVPGYQFLPYPPGPGYYPQEYEVYYPHPSAYVYPYPYPLSPPHSGGPGMDQVSWQPVQPSWVPAGNASPPPRPPQQ